MSSASRVAGAAVLAIAVGLSSGCGRQGTPEAAVGAAKRVAVRAPGDAEAGQSFATPAGVVLTERAPAPEAARSTARRAAITARAKAKTDFVSPGAPSDAQIAAELHELDRIQTSERRVQRSATGITLERDGTATVPPGVPAVVARVVAGANAIAKFPYVYGGGHASFVDTAYDCSGSLSYALAAGGLLSTTKTSGELARGGDEGPGRWITIYANPGHTFMVVNGLRFDTSGRGGPRGSRWQSAPRSIAGFTVRHPRGL